MATTIYLTNVASDVVDAHENLVARVGVRGSGLSTGTADTGAPSILTRDTVSDVEIYWWTPSLDAVTVSGSMTLNVWASESNMSANVGVGLGYNRFNVDGTIDLSGALGGPTTAEVAVTTRAAISASVTPTSTTYAAGQRMRFFLSESGSTGGFTWDVGWAGTSASADGDTWVQFTETITEQGGAVAHNPPFSNAYRQLIAHFRAKRFLFLNDLWRPGSRLLLPE